MAVSYNYLVAAQGIPADLAVTLDQPLPRDPPHGGKGCVFFGTHRDGRRVAVKLQRVMREESAFTDNETAVMQVAPTARPTSRYFRARHR